MSARRAFSASLALLTVVGVATVAVSSCSNVLGLESYQDATAELCSLLDRCYGSKGLKDCLAHVQGRFDAAGTDATRASWLEYLNANHCLADCESAIRCLDEPPVCAPSRVKCATKQECCGFSKGLGDCDTGHCCAPHGVVCESDNDCCPGQGPCTRKTCGGVACKPSGSACAADGECCTQICGAGGTCSDLSCLDGPFDCSSDEQCCSKHCIGGKCSTPQCVDEGLDCSATPCCNDDCYTTPAGAQVCSAGQCTPDDLPCLTPDECCTQLCSTTAGVIGTCGTAPVCGATGDLCSVGTDCCDGNCNAGVCGVITTCPHGVCEAGMVPLDSSVCPDEAACIKTVCTCDAFCCGGTTGGYWDQYCVCEAQLYCGQPCGATCDPTTLVCTGTTPL